MFEWLLRHSFLQGDLCELVVFERNRVCVHADSGRGTALNVPTRVKVMCTSFTGARLDGILRLIDSPFFISLLPLCRFTAASRTARMAM